MVADHDCVFYIRLAGERFQTGFLKGYSLNLAMVIINAR